MSRLREIEDYVKRLYETVETKLDGQEADHLAKDLTDSLGSSLQDKDMGMFFLCLVSSGLIYSIPDFYQIIHCLLYSILNTV